jgi:hypothetical protein
MVNQIRPWGGEDFDLGSSGTVERQEAILFPNDTFANG